MVGDCGSLKALFPSGLGYADKTPGPVGEETAEGGCDVGVIISLIDFAEEQCAEFGELSEPCERSFEKSSKGNFIFGMIGLEERTCLNGL